MVWWTGGSHLPSEVAESTTSVSILFPPVGSCARDQSGWMLMAQLLSDNRTPSNFLLCLQNKKSPEVREIAGFSRAPAWKLPWVKVFWGEKKIATFNHYDTSSGSHSVLHTFSDLVFSRTYFPKIHECFHSHGFKKVFNKLQFADIFVVQGNTAHVLCSIQGDMKFGVCSNY